MKKNNSSLRAKIKVIVLAIVLLLIIIIPSTPASALASQFQSAACQGVSQISSSQNCGSANAKGVVSNLFSTATTILSMIVGAVSVIMIMFAGFKYTTAAGDANKITSAKTTLIYAIVGLIIASIAYLIASVVLGSASQIAGVIYIPTI